MAATNRYISLNPGHLRVGKITETSGGTATDEVELRMLITKADGATATNLTHKTVLDALRVFEIYLKRGGVNEFMNNKPAAGGLPDPSGPPAAV